MKGSRYSTHVIDDLSSDPSLEVGGRHHNSLDVGLSDGGGLCLLDGLRSSVGLSIRAGVGVDLGLSLSSSESVFDNLGLVDDLGGNPYTGCRNELHGGEDFRRGLEVGENLGRCLVDSDCGGNDLGLQSIMSGG